MRLRYQNCNIDDDALSVATNLSYSLGPSWSNLCNVLNQHIRRVKRYRWPKFASDMNSLTWQ